MFTYLLTYLLTYYHKMSRYVSHFFSLSDRLTG